MPYLTEFITVATINILAVMSPGPAFAMIVRNSLVYSKKTAIFSSIGLGFGVGLHIFYCLFGIGLLISKSIVLFSILKYIGAGYLFFIGYQSLNPNISSLNIASKSKKKDISEVHAFKIGFITNATNPRATLFFLSIFTQVINPNTPLFIQILYGLEMMVAEMLWFIFVSSIFSHKIIKGRLEKIQFFAERLMGIILIGLGIKLLLSSIK